LGQFDEIVDVADDLLLAQFFERQFFVANF